MDIIYFHFFGPTKLNPLFANSLKTSAMTIDPMPFLARILKAILALKPDWQFITILLIFFNYPTLFYSSGSGMLLNPSIYPID